MKKLTTLVAILLFIVTLFAQAPEKFTYQAVVRNASNELVANTQVGVRVNILQGSATGNAVYSESHVITTNTNGLITVNIGGGNVLHSSFAGIDWADGPFFLKTDIDPKGGNDYSITSTQQLLSVPYALYAKEAANSFSGDYNDLTNTPNIPTVPTNVSAFTNDSHYITEAQLNALLAAMNNTIDSLRNRIEELENGGTPVNPDPVNPDTTTTPVNPDTTITPDTPVYIDGLACPGIAMVTDIDGNVYNTVQIGNQCWMKENMRAKHYADGSSISYYAYSSSDIPLEQRGYFYTWSAVMNGASSSDTTPSGVQGICPTGWHVPSKGEWTELSQYVGSQSQYLCGNNSNYIAKALASTQRW
jgi:hypothetical protein